MTDATRQAWPRSRWLLLVAAIGVALAAALMPHAWYDALPRQAELPPPPISGVTVLRLVLAVEAAVLLLVAAFDWRFVRMAPTSRLAGHLQREESGDLTPRAAAVGLTIITLVALALRVYHLDRDLWLDEISPILDYASLSVPQIVGSYLRSNNHLLNTLLLKGMIALFGEQAWSVRLPAVAFGVAGVPALYWCARLALSRRASLGAALLLAVSYHHLFFSQNARGYTAYLCLALLSTRALVNGLRDDRGRDWLLYVMATVLGVAALLNTAFVLAAQGLVALAVVWRVHRAGGAAMPLLRRVLVVLAIAGFLSAELYAVAMPEVYVVISNVYKTQSTGFVLFSWEFAREVLRGVSAGFGSGGVGVGALLAAVPFLLVAAAGAFAVLRRAWALALALALPGVLTLAFLLVRGLTISPRFFLLWLPLAVLTAVVAIDAGAGWIWRARPRRAALMGTGTVAVLAMLSAASLGRYYAIPKQPYRAALAYVERARKPDDRVVVVYLAELGMRYYGARAGAPLDERYRFVRTVPALDSALAQRGAGRVWLVVTFERALQMDLPELNARVHSGWTLQHTFDGTVGDGGISVWRERDAAATSGTAP
ncbi:glycosyltransferase family 39 protein [Gemmatimonas sp.]|uniref:glycosyltransferase family 39 protein n=1 Tax=Gemmatimonas sp. TaxID=1962908 RepID=UPI00286D548D|nr:glycosyltransferase family 39 protein [Gemmatimonas sp.]